MKNYQLPKITVYITNYNYGHFIEKAIQSVLQQTLQDFELIIIDDGSEDNSREIIERYADYSKIKIIFQKNKGLNVSNNIAMRASKGAYIMRLDADDYLDHNALLVLSNKLDQDDELGLVFPDYFIVDEQDEVQSVERRHSFEKDVTLLDQPAHGACTMIRKEYLENIGGYDEDFSCQDGYELWIKFVAKYKVANVNTPLFYYRRHSQNLTGNENRILNTRSKILHKFADSNGIVAARAMAVIPVRGAGYNSNQLAFHRIGGMTLLQRKISAVKQAGRVQKIVVTSPDSSIARHLEEISQGDPNILFHKREEKLARLNTGLIETIENVLEFEPVRTYNPELLVTLSLEYPFSGGREIDDAINTLMIFQTDSLVSVRPSSNMLFQHHGGGMKAIMEMDKFSKLERETLFEYTGGIIVTKAERFKKDKALITGKVGHIMVDQKAAHRLSSTFDLQIAEYLDSLQ